MDRLDVFYQHEQQRLLGQIQEAQAFLARASTGAADRFRVCVAQSGIEVRTRILQVDPHHLTAAGIQARLRVR